MESRDQKSDRERLQELERKRGTVGEGMDSPDSTEVPLDASTGRPDRRTEKDQRSGSKGS